jgi:maltose-binding protein MalE
MKLQSKWLVAAFAILAFVAVSTVNAAPATWTGKLSDAMCGASHGSNGGTQDKDHDCAVKCVKGGSTYVFVNNADKKTYKIANQNFADLEKHAGHTVVVTGEMKDGSITVSKIAMPAAK